MERAYDFTTEDGLRAYLEFKQHTPVGTSSPDDRGFKVDMLSGGTANYVYRVTTPDGSSSIYKHAAPYLHSNKKFAFDPIRMDYEARILESLLATGSPSSLTSGKSCVHAVRLLSYQRNQKLLHIEDGGRGNLKEAYTEPELDIPQVGKELATWVAALHVGERQVSLALPGQEKSLSEGNNQIAVAIYRHSYNNLHAALEQFGHDVQLAHRINEEFGGLLQTDDECICHGDFWPGNVLVRLDASATKPVELTVVDWEMVRRGTSATDVGQFAAEAFLLDRFRGGRGLLRAFLNAYVDARKDVVPFGKVWLVRMAVHWAVHVAFWPTQVAWTDKEGTQKLVDISVGVLQQVLARDWDGLLASPLLRDVREAYAPVLE
ncbi:kinase-like protein [Decorospora gaudefroyi]|uniref:Kinase-like protein n=1 Tax=Decorospora gaudefroyi TaxID=184978 RepID=A0A6A5KSM2_9PLEO|nr:kinase-like protein [Decorospora gaudefroyi]